MSTKRQERIRKIWAVFAILIVLSMIAFTLAPLFGGHTGFTGGF